MPFSTTVLVPRWLLLSVLAAAPAWAPCVAAHAFLDHSTPAADSALEESPTSVKLWFSEPIERAFSKVEVANDANQRVDERDAQVDRANPKLLQVSLPRLTAGKYRVTWRAVSIDTHVSRGEFSF